MIQWFNQSYYNLNDPIVQYNLIKLNMTTKKEYNFDDSTKYDLDILISIIQRVILS